MSANRLKILISLRYPTPFFNIPEEGVEMIREKCAPSLVSVANDAQELLQEMVDADIYFGWRITKELFRVAKKLKWFHAGAAGIGSSLFTEIVQSPLIVTNSIGVSASAVAEHAVGLMLALNRKLKKYVNYQQKGYWSKDELGSLSLVPQILEGKSLGIIGLGHIGRELARRARCFGMRIIAAEKRIPPAGIEGIDKLLPEEDLPILLRESDYVAICIPLTKNTWGLIGEEELRLMKPTAYLVNIARGKIVKQKELIEALKQGDIAGAALDVFEKEPLSKNSQLWDMENVIITPHIAGVFPDFWRKCVNLFVENYRRFVHGKELINIVNKSEGF